MLQRMIDRAVEKRLREFTDKTAQEIVERYAREALKSPILVQETSEIITVPGTSVTLYSLVPKTPTIVGGYIDFSGMSAEDTMSVEIDHRLRNDLKWRKYDKKVLRSTQDSPVFFIRDVFVIAGVKIVLTHESGVGKKIYHCFYRRK